MTRRFSVHLIDATQDGRRLCRWCGTPVVYPRRSWCSRACVEEYKDAMNWGLIRARVYERDRGLCRICDIDPEKERRERERTFQDALAEAMKSKPAVTTCGNARTERMSGEPRRTIWKQYTRGAALYGWPADFSRDWYEIDHIVPIHEGGTDADSNLRTLCVPCHKRETRALRARMKARKNLPAGMPPRETGMTGHDEQGEGR